MNHQRLMAAEVALPAHSRCRPLEPDHPSSCGCVQASTCNTAPPPSRRLSWPGVHSGTHTQSGRAYTLEKEMPCVPNMMDGSAGGDS